MIKKIDTSSFNIPAILNDADKAVSKHHLGEKKDKAPETKKRFRNKKATFLSR